MIPGLPRSLAQDGWWLDAPSAAAPASPHDPVATPARLLPWAGLAALVALADFLFWHHGPGLSLALFALAILAVASIGIRARRTLWRPALLLAMAAAPVAAITTNPSLRTEIPNRCAIFVPPTIEGWRDWGFRSWRVARYSDATATLGQRQ